MPKRKKSLRLKKTKLTIVRKHNKIHSDKVKKQKSFKKLVAPKVKKERPLIKFNPRPRSVSETKMALASSSAFSSIPWSVKFENVVGIGSITSGPWSAPKHFGTGVSNTDVTSYSYTSLTVWNSASTHYNNTCNTVAYNDAYTGSASSDAGKIYLWFKAPPGSYTISIKWKAILKASGTHGRSVCNIVDVADPTHHKQVMTHFIQTSASPWSDSGTYDINVTTTDEDWHVVLYYDPTLNFNNRSPAHADTGTAEGHLDITNIKQN
jgi:hypothetical protein